MYNYILRHNPITNRIWRIKDSLSGNRNHCKLQASILLRIALLISLVLLAQFQLFNAEMESTGTSDTRYYTNTAIPGEVVRQPLANISLPIETGPVSPKDVQWAVKYLRLPTWSAGYVPCDSPHSEVSCFEVVRAAKTIQSWETNCSNRLTNGVVYVSARRQKFTDLLSMAYHAVQIAIATGRRVAMDTHLLRPLVLPKVLHSNDLLQSGVKIEADYRFSCCDVSLEVPNLRITGAAWPQALYTHHVVGPFLRAHFGYHAAYFIGNWLFGSDVDVGECATRRDWVVEGWSLVPKHPPRIDSYPEALWKSGVEFEKAELVTNMREVKGVYYSDVYSVKDTNDEMACALRKIQSAKRIIQTWGSMLSWWANALQGRPGMFVNWISMVPVNLTFSQQGSLWNTECDIELAPYIYRINSWLYVCGPNIYDVKLYLDYLLW